MLFYALGSSVVKFCCLPGELVDPMRVSLGVFPPRGHCPVGSPGWLGRFPASRWPVGPVSRWPGVPLARCPVVPLARCPVVPLSRWPGVPLSRCPVGGGAPLLEYPTIAGHFVSDVLLKASFLGGLLDL